jgi:hypothetical protein
MSMPVLLRVLTRVSMPRRVDGMTTMSGRIRMMTSCRRISIGSAIFARGALVASVALPVALAGCNDLTGSQPLPAGTADPGVVANQAGARASANAARAQFQDALVSYIVDAGTLADELQDATPRIGTQTGSALIPYVAVDARLLPQGGAVPGTTLGTDEEYVILQQTRALTNQAIGALQAYDADSSADNRGELYALEGYAEVMLADLFCSGVPLSTSNFQHDFTYAPSSTTAQVYQHAMALFDTAMTLSKDDARIVGLASVGKARALLAQGNYAAAATAVAAVPVAFQYADTMQSCNVVSGGSCVGAYAKGQPVFTLLPGGSVADQEGGNGLPFRSSGDPRSASTLLGSINNTPVYFPNKYSQSGLSVLVVASGVEAQLIAAEAALAAGSSDWLTILNALRTDGTQTGGTYNAGTGGVAGLPPLTDPGNDADRVSLLFQERGYWLFLSGQRQGDLRRLVRQYHRDQETVYPTGEYPGVGSYGTFIDAPIPISGVNSELSNPLFHGCLSRD